MNVPSLAEWLVANEAAVDEAQKMLTKKGGFIIPLEKPWPEWEEKRRIADEKWYEYRKQVEKLK